MPTTQSKKSKTKKAGRRSPGAASKVGAEDRLRSIVAGMTHPTSGDFTIQEIANVAGMDRANLSRWIHGYKSVSVATLEAIAHACGRRVEFVSG
jgi:transcriptional regulator GlxA family with amidase domain